MKISLKTFIAIVLIIMVLVGIVAFVAFKQMDKKEPTKQAEKVTPTKTSKEEIDLTDQDSLMRKLKTMSEKEIIEKLENLSDEELGELSNRPNAVLIKDLPTLDNFNEKLDLNEYWYTNPIGFAGAVSSKEDCEAKLSTVKEEGTGITYKYIGENDYYYEYKVTKLRLDDSKQYVRYIFVKNSIVQIPNTEEFEGVSYYTLDKATFKKIDEKTIKTLLDLNIVLSPDQVIYRNIEEDDDSFVYTEYETEVSYNEETDEVSLIKNIYKVDKETGVVTKTIEVLKDKVQL